MRYCLIGILIGLLSALLPVSFHETALELYPEWLGTISSAHAIEQSPDPLLEKQALGPIADANDIFILSGSGALLYKAHLDDSLAAVSGNGKYYVKYFKAGKSIEFCSIQGDRFWKLPSLEYPFLSYNGVLILLLNGDLSGLRLIDNNGNETGVKNLQGRFCTSISFAPETDYSCVGFFDGSFYALDRRGAIAYQGLVPGYYPVKSAAVSDNGAYCAVHHGGAAHDAITIVDIQKQRAEVFGVRSVHYARTAIHVAHNGDVCFLDHRRILLIDATGSLRRVLPVPEKRPGQSSLGEHRGVYVAAYTQKSGEAYSIVFTREGTVLQTKDFPEESFLDCHIGRSSILLRGNRNLYCYSYLQ